MSFLSYIDRLRTMPIKERREIANTWTVVLVGVIFFVWAALTLWRFGVVATPVPSTDSSVPSSSGITPPY
jgi:hypothetical protein